MVYNKVKNRLQLHLTADKREIVDFPKPSPLSRKRVLKGRNIGIGKFAGLEVKSKCMEGWASFIRKPIILQRKPGRSKALFK